MKKSDTQHDGCDHILHKCVNFIFRKTIQGNRTNLVVGIPTKQLFGGLVFGKLVSFVFGSFWLFRYFVSE